MKLIILPFLLFAACAQSKIVDGVGQAALEHHSNSIINACEVAKSRAINNALIENLGSEFTAFKSNYCFDTKDKTYCNYYKDVTSNVSGTIKRVIDSKTNIYNNICFVNLKLEVEESRSLGAKVTGKNIYKVGEKLKYDIEVEEPMYLYVFNVYDKEVDLIFPLFYNDNNYIKKGYEFPGNGMKYIAYVNDLSKESEETMLFLFTKHEVFFNVSELTEEALNDIISELPVHSRKVFRFKILIKE